MAQRMGLCLVSGTAMLLAACGGGGNSGGGGGGNPTTPTVTVTPGKTSITTADPLTVNVTVTGSSSTPTGTVTLSSGGYTSFAATLSGGSASFTIAAGKLAAGSDAIKASYLADSASSSIYNSASGTATVTATLAVPTITVKPASSSIASSQPLSVTVAVAGVSGDAVPTGSVTLSSGSYTSTAANLTNGSASISVPANTLAAGSATLTASYSPDTASTGIYGSASGSGNVTVTTLITPTVTVTPASLSIDTTEALDVAVAVTGPGTGAPVPGGLVSVTIGGSTSLASATLSGGGATITIAAGTLPAGSDTLTVSYTPDEASASIYNSTSGVSAAVTVLLASTVAVTQGVSIGTVTDQLMGMNLAAWYDVVGSAGSINPAFALAGVKAIRWPGGSWSDAWHWRTSTTNLLPYMCSGTGSGTSWGGYSSFSDFVTAIPKAGSYDLALTANYGSNAACTGGGDPTEAAAWAADAVAEGYPPSHMTVGNEEYGSWEFDLHAKKNDPITYAGSVVGSNGYYTLIKAASPTTKVGVVVDAGSIQAGWDTTVLTQAKGSYDFVEFHWYPANPGQENDTYLVHTAAQGLSKAIQTLKSEMTAAKVLNLPIYVGEMGSVSSNPGKQTWSITQGLYAGQTLGEMMNAGVSRATWWIGFGNCNEDNKGNPLGNMSASLYGWQTFGAYNVFSDGPTDGPCGVGSGAIGTMSPTARAFQLFSNIAESGATSAEEVLGATVTGDTTNIRAYAATNNGGTALFLFNLNENQSEPVTITLSRQTATSGGTMTTYDKSIYDQTNAPTPVWAGPTTTPIGAQNLPLKLTLTPWSMNVVTIK